ncbi:DUF418 domain-containing protein [Nocardiopsis sp. HUAS JQ3]|uniref:DUF418 domain-containing protein n=1 Tax=Nocardiopsis sp. HUAS JQ3 TaxID=3061629 RepID=UPI0023A99653|nr:DUF418 domain-containing protein [Nocardiopsis sp. HUAS JQ3]WDZ92658.1 DUF418 domain-containing protein [Nocardiopsis sp. HUAS JQ3]
MTAPASRALAPDLARGAMLLAIACAHAPLFVLAVERGPALANGAALVLHELFVGNQARPMFAFLFGYALTQTLDRRVARGADPADAHALLRRRGWWLLAFGLVHTLIAPLDILAAYGLASLLLMGLLRARSATLLRVAGLALVPGTVLSAVPLVLALSQGVSTFDIGSVATPPGSDPGTLYLERLPGAPFALAIGTVLVAPAVVAGMWAARRRLLEEPEHNRALLVRAVVLTTAVSVAGALPSILVQTGTWSAPSAAAQWSTALLQPLTGYFGGVGMAGIVALVAIRASRGRGTLTTAVQALGQRSLTFYLLQSVVFLAVFSPAGLGWQDRLGLAGAFGVAAATWLASLAAADLMRRAGRRGPAEGLLRRLTRRAAPRDPRQAPSSA